MTEQQFRDDNELFRQSHRANDADSDRSSLHHTLGPGPNQAAPGNHLHRIPRARMTRFYNGVADKQLISPTTVTKTIFTTKNYDSPADIQVDIPNSRLVIKRSGLWFVNAQTSWEGSTYNPSRRLTQLFKNGVEFGRNVTFPTHNVLTVLPAESPVECVAGDYIELMCYQDTNTPINLSPAQEYLFLQAYLIGT